MSDIEQIKINLPKELKDKFVKKAKKNNLSQTSAIKKLIIKFVNE
jgi:metal-responsive CopG/Arc/MetJ family transcriptional regulator